MSKKLDKTEVSDEIRQHQPSRFEISSKPYFRFSPSLDTEEIEILDSTNNPRLSDKNNPQKEDIFEKSEKRNETFVDGSEENKIEFDCKKCGEEFKDIEDVMAHDCPHKVTTESPLDIKSIFDLVKQKQLREREAENSPDENIKSDSSRSRTSSVALHKVRASGRSYSGSITPCSERKIPKIVYNRYPIYVTPPRSIPSSQAIKDYSSNARDSATKNIFQSRKTSCSATESRPLQAECIKTVSEQSLTLVTPKERSSSPPDLFRGKPSRILSRLDASYNLQSPRGSCTAITRRPPEIEVVGRVYTKYPALGTPPRSISLSHTQKYDSSGSVMDPVPMNLFQSHQMHNTEMISDPSGSVRIPTVITLDQSPRIFSSEISTDCSGRKVIPAAVNLVQSPEIYDTETITDSSANRMIPGDRNHLFTVSITSVL
ncbi:hypothetical protein TNCT_467331 [Trichonephila clavata]|uniref:C2H2-type domain-containing protein n=1 Tax=Trichonephila clavata TaxID=2740835 RepID=A0A8X6GWX9_TRICU|nr:hypothetical protein TNCT_467331 [Trichonephila clavata]